MRYWQGNAIGGAGAEIGVAGRVLDRGEIDSLAYRKSSQLAAVERPDDMLILYSGRVIEAEAVAYRLAERVLRIDINKQAIVAAFPYHYAGVAARLWQVGIVLATSQGEG